PRGDRRVHGADDDGLSRARAAALPRPGHRRARPLHAQGSPPQPGHHGNRPGGQAVRSGGVFWAALGAVLCLAGGAFAGHDTLAPVVSLRSDYVKRLLDAREAVVLVDMRKGSEYRAGHLPGAISVPLTELDRRFTAIPRTARVVLYCECPRE